VRRDFRRWLAWFAGLVGVLSFVDYPLLFVGTETGDLYGIVYFLLLILLLIAFAVALWRREQEPEARPSGFE